MENLFGRKDCDTVIATELILAGITIVRGALQPGEVPTITSGQLGRFTFERAACYWMVSGDMPIEVARELYADPVGKTDIRVAGHCGRLPPDGGWAIWKTSDDPKSLAKEYIDSYHIDSELGLYKFAETIRKYDLR